MTYSIQAENLSKQYRIGKPVRYRMLRDSIQESARDLWQNLSAFTRNGSGNGDKTGNLLWALKDISFKIETGDSCGIIGSNGAGKSTLLKIIARVTIPSRGRVRIKGRVGSLLEVGTGFHPELTGRENIFLNGAILGMRKREIEHKFDEIVDFSEIEQFLDTPVKFYSSGMRLRLAFSVAAHLDPEILLVDEILAVGDNAFQNKSLNKMENVVRAGRTVLFVSHNMASIRALCKSAIYIEHGQVKYIGAVETAIQTYLKTGAGQQGAFAESKPDPSLGMQVLEVSVINTAGEPSKRLPHDQPFSIRVKVAYRRPDLRTTIAVHIHDAELNTLFSSFEFEQDENLLVQRKLGVYLYHIQVPAPLLIPGNYRLSVEARRPGRQVFHALPHVCPYEVYDNGSVFARVRGDWVGKAHIPFRWQCLELLPLSSEAQSKDASDNAAG
ncbi:MAG TPA: ABC transporter ATP-binding protein [Levilinea sp.]|nr:ABC transporter ATP-binding protein [Levilinea sp.]